MYTVNPSSPAKLPNFLALVANVTLEQAKKHSNPRQGLVPRNRVIYMEFFHSKFSVMPICAQYCISSLEDSCWAKLPASQNIQKPDSKYFLPEYIQPSGCTHLCLLNHLIGDPFDFLDFLGRQGSLGCEVKPQPVRCDQRPSLVSFPQH